MICLPASLQHGQHLSLRSFAYPARTYIQLRLLSNWRRSHRRVGTRLPAKCKSPRCHPEGGLTRRPSGAGVSQAERVHMQRVLPLCRQVQNSLVFLAVLCTRTAYSKSYLHYRATKTKRRRNLIRGGAYPTLESGHSVADLFVGPTFDDVSIGLDDCHLCFVSR